MKANIMFVYIVTTHFIGKMIIVSLQRIIFITFQFIFSQRNLERHISVVHEQKKSYECEYCGITFARRERLKQHMATECAHTVHSDIIVKDEAQIQQNYTIQVQTFSDQHGEAIQTHQIQISDQ